MELDKINGLVDRIDSLPFETRTFILFSQKADLLDRLLEQIRQMPVSGCEHLSQQVLQSVQKNATSLTYSLDYVRGDMKKLTPADSSFIKEKLHRIGYSLLIFSRTLLSLTGQDYLEVLHSSKALIKYDKSVIENLDFEIRLVGYNLNKHPGSL